MTDYNADESHLLERPRWDMLLVKFRGDNHTVVLPYCEVANGRIVGTKDNTITCGTHNMQTDKEELVHMSFATFTQVIEASFDIKEIVYLAVQLQGATEITQIL